MAYVDGHLGGLVGGVSQQPDILRRDGQCTLQNNMFIDYTEGLKRRPRVDTLSSALVTTADPNDVFTHYFEHNAKTYILVIDADEIKVFDTLGVAQTLAIGSTVRTYLDANKLALGAIWDASAISAVQVGDYNLVANNRQRCKMDATSLQRPSEEIICFYFKDGMEWGLTYEIKEGSVIKATYTSPAGDTVDATTIEQIQSNYIAANLFQDLIALEANPITFATGFSGSKGGASVTLSEGVVDNSGHTAPIVGQWFFINQENKYYYISGIVHTPEYTELVTVDVGDSGSDTRKVTYPGYYTYTLTNCNQGTGVNLGTAASLLFDYSRSNSTNVRFDNEADTAIRNATLGHVAGWPAAPDVGWKWENKGSVITGSRPRPINIDEGADGSIGGNWSIDDSRAGAHTSMTVHQVDSFDDLPPRTKGGHVVKVSQRESTQIDDMWMKFEANAGQGQISQGSWKETVQPGITIAMDNTTLPIALVPSVSGFAIDILNGQEVDDIRFDKWGTRTAGDELKNPSPAFIGKYIEGMRIFNNRLALMTTDSVALSRPKKEFMFFSETIRTVLDTDPLNLDAPGDSRPDLHSMVDHERHLVLTGNEHQYAIKGTSALTPATANIFQTTALDTLPKVQPVAAGRVIFMPYKSGDYVGFREYYTGSVTESNDSLDITSHVNKYMDEGVHTLIVDKQKDLLIVAPTPSASKTMGNVYIYQHLWRNDERLVQAWYKWTFPFQVLSGRISGSTFTVVGWSAQHGTRMYSIDMNMVDDTDAGLYVHADNRFTGETIVADATGRGGTIDISTWTHPMVGATKDDIVAVIVSGVYAGMTVQVAEYTYGGSIVLNDVSGAGVAGEDVVVGLRYLSEYTPTMPVVRDGEDRAVQTGDLTVGTLEAQMYETGSLTAEVSGEYYPTNEQYFSGRVLGDTIIGVPAEASARFQVSVRQDARRTWCRFWTDAHTHMTFQAIEWTGQYTKRGQRI